MKCKYLSEYHGDAYCKCVADSCDCNGNTEQCTHPSGKQCYEQDLEEDKK